MESLLRWLSDFNDTSEKLFKLNDCEIQMLLHQYECHLVDKYQQSSDPKNETNNPFRASSLGKPALVIAHRYYHPNNSQLLPNKKRRLADIGHYFERWLTTQITGLGYEVFANDSGATVILHGVGVTCHADLIVDKKILIECKEVNDWYFKQWFKYNKRSDDRGYLTQASLYSYVYQKPIMFIVGNRQTGELGWFCMSDEDVSHYVNRAKSVVDVLVNKTKSWEECFKYMSPLPPNQTKEGLTVHYSMNEIKNLVYELDDYGYVLDYKYPQQYEHLKPKL